MIKLFDKLKTKVNFLGGTIFNYKSYLRPKIWNRIKEHFQIKKTYFCKASL